jgi:drug/metabolite transporter (DMT)-like permease
VLFVIGAIVAGRPLAPSAMPAAAWPNLVGLGFASTFLAIQGFYAGSRRIGAAQAALISTVEPVVIVGLAWLLLGDILRPLQLVGAGLVIVGVLVAQTGSRPQNAPQPARPLDAESGL